MNIRVNGEERHVKSDTLAALLEELDYGDATVATAHNKNFVRKKDRTTARLADGDEVEILTPRQGG